MKFIFQAVLVAILFPSALFAAEVVSYFNYIRQYQEPSGVTYDASNSVAPNGFMDSSLPINPGGAIFKLVTVRSSSATGLTEFPLASSYVGTYIPLAEMVVRSEDTTSEVIRTRADRPFYLDVTVSGLLNGATDPGVSKSVTFLRHVQSYGAGGTGVGIDRTQATLLKQTSISANGTQNLTFAINAVPGANRTKIRGEERFSIFSQEDNRQASNPIPAKVLALQSIQIWPVADGTISGISANQVIRFAMPDLTIALNDLYPSSTTYAQVYKGGPQLNVQGSIIPGSQLVISESVPQNRVLSLANYDNSFDKDGVWTMEVLTQTPFGIDRLAHVSFTLDRTIEVNSTVTTVE